MDGEFCHRDFWKIMMDALHNIIPKSIVEVLNRLENDEDNRYSWKLTRNQDSLSLTVSCKLPTKTPNKAKDDSQVAGRATVKPVRRRRKKRNSPSALARSRRRHARFLEKKLAGKPDSPSPEDQQDSVCVKELENTSLVCGSDRDLESSDNPTPAPAVEPPFLDGDVPRSTSYGVYISQLIRFARASSYVTDFNTRNKLLTQKLLKQGYRYHKLRKTFSKFYRRYFDLISKFQVGLKSLLRQGLSEPDFYGDLVYKLKKIVGSNNFSAQFIKIISHYKKIGYNINVLQQTACLVVNPITVGNFAFLFNCTPVGRTSDSMMVPT